VKLAELTVISALTDYDSRNEYFPLRDYDGTIAYDVLPSDSLLTIYGEAHTDYASEVYSRTQRTLSPLGAYRFADVTVAGSWMAVYNSCSGHILNALPGFGWSDHHIKHFISKHGNTHSDQTPARIIRAPSVLLSFPGGHTFGHWLVDIIARVKIMQMLCPQVQFQYLVPSPFHPYMQALLAFVGIPTSDVVSIADGQSIQIADLYVPTFASNDGCLHQRLFRELFTKMRDSASAILPQRPPINVLYVKHTPMTSQNSRSTLHHSETLEQLLIDQYGAAVADPLHMTFQEQIAMFAAARTVVAEDSSAAHNILWSRTAGLIVLSSPARLNFYHAGIQLTENKPLSIIYGGEIGNSFTISKSALVQAVDQHSQRK
jgi:hypothetical protein